MSEHQTYWVVGIITVSVLVLLGTLFFVIPDEQQFIPDKTPYGVRSSSGNAASGFDVVSLLQSGVNRNVDCSPSSGYDRCFAWERTEESGGDAVARAYVEVQGNSVPVGIKKGNYYVGDVYIPYKFVGDKYYYAEGVKSWDDLWNNVAKCSESGCKGNTIPSEGKLLIASAGQEYNKCPVFYAWDYDRADGEDESWAWVWKSGGWGWVGDPCSLNVKSVECYEDIDCGDPELNFCDKSGDWKTWNCMAKTKFYRYSEEANTCSEVVLAPSQRTAADYATLAECEEQIKHPEYVWYAIIGGILGLSLLGGLIWFIARRR